MLAQVQAAAAAMNWHKYSDFVRAYGTVGLSVDRDTCADYCLPCAGIVDFHVLEIIDFQQSFRQPLAVLSPTVLSPTVLSPTVPLPLLVCQLTGRRLFVKLLDGR